ncbi:hypothetical protein N7468_009929 [Penicillium chermesinum]|uniref:tRNA-specific adenosine-34 deaminase subunit Tad3 n=1 Tax=Penicillium chermesinum TaxID=63820 RepID=A0A9W9TBY9_9EURO|nr:uncharacterized protein N7468_009929 [Penicillium chermesinum]KAJ5216921.1 hypothetical protein N7468_009929 [Penicillium chermesinum]KAJ6171467.1 hypothetical protein N7470_000534 [Penicillium chermesinum]
MGVQEIVNAIEPLQGDVIPIKTIQEVVPIEEFGDAYIAEVNVKAASKVIKALDAAFKTDPPSPSLPHLRRFAKRDALPGSVRAAIEAVKTDAGHHIPTIYVVIPPPLPSLDELLEVLAPYAPETYKPRSSPASDQSSPEPAPSKITIVKSKIPLSPPFSIAQANKWTKNLWPVTFNPAAPRSTVAPPPQVLARAQDSIRPRAGYYLSLAREVAKEALESGRGRGVGAVIVDPSLEEKLEAAAAETGSSSIDRWSEAVVAVSGDARYNRSEGGALSQAALHHGMGPNPATETYNSDLEGGPDLHALMRAIDLVARGRRENNEGAADATSPPVLVASTLDLQLSSDLTPLESYFFSDVNGMHHPSTASSPVASADSPCSPKKRKLEEPNPESGSASLGVLPTNSLSPSPLDPAKQLVDPPLPAPPPSTMAASASSGLTTPPPTSAPTIEGIHVDHPTATTKASRIRSRSEGGYLCTDLDVYVSHEPCVCCSMGMLLSRFRAVVFPRSGRMETGGITSEPAIAPMRVEDESDWGGSFSGEPWGDSADEDVDKAPERVYYGLHWRKELNWRALGFEFVEDDVSEESSTGVNVAFHA